MPEIAPPIQFPIPPVEQVTGDFQPLIPHLFQAVLQTQARVILETGTDVGDSTRIWSAALAQYTGGHVTSVDIKGPKDGWWHPPLHYNITCIKHDALTYDWHTLADIIFLDDEHSHEHVAKELVKYAPWVRPGGLLLLHDTQHSEFGPGILMAVKEFVEPRGLPFRQVPVAHGLGIIEMPLTWRG